MTKLGLSGASTFSLGIYFRETFHYVRVYVEASILGSYTLGRGRYLISLRHFGSSRYTPRTFLGPFLAPRISVARYCNVY